LVGENRSKRIGKPARISRGNELGRPAGGVSKAEEIGTNDRHGRGHRLNEHDAKGLTTEVRSAINIGAPQHPWFARLRDRAEKAGPHCEPVRKLAGPSGVRTIAGNDECCVKIAESGHRLNQHLETLSSLDATEKEDRLSRPEILGLCSGKTVDVDSVWREQVGTRKVPLNESAGGVGNRRANRKAFDQLAQDRRRSAVGAAPVARGVKSADRGSGTVEQREQRKARNQRLMQMNDVGAKTAECAPNARSGARAERNWGDRSIGGDADRAADEPNVGIVGGHAAAQARRDHNDAVIAGPQPGPQRGYV
jgi:hypothetical protein